MRRRAALAMILAWMAVWGPASAQSGEAVAAFNGVWVRNGSGLSPPPAYNAEYGAHNKAMLDAIKAGHATPDPTASCLYGGMPRVMTPALPMEIAVTPGRVFIMFEWNGETRRIYTDGRGHPADPDPSFEGHSIGKWRDGQLLVDTAGLRADTLFVASGGPHSDAMHITERMWIAAPDTLTDEITVNDPKAFLKPWVITKTYQRQPTWEIQEYVCAENNRNPAQGNDTGIVLIPKH